MYPIWATHILMLLAVVITYIDNSMYFLKITDEREKQQVDYAINAASDAAIERMLDTTKNAANNSIIVDPDYIWKVYKYTFLRSNNLYSEAAMQTVEASFPSVVISVNDGYYVRLMVDTDVKGNLERQYRFTQKLPYARTTRLATTITDGPDGKTSIPAGAVVADTLDGKNLWVYNFQQGSDYTVVQSSTSPLPSKIGSAHDLNDVNRMLLGAIEYAMFFNSSASATSKNDGSKFTVPDAVTAELDKPSVNFAGPTVFAFSDNFNMRGKTYSNLYSVGASQIVQATNYYTYVRNGYKYYSRRHPDNITGASNMGDIYTTPRQAASDGYYPDPLFY